MIQEESHNIKYDDKDQPIAILFRTKEGLWVWYGIQSLSAEDNVELLKTK